MGVKNIERLIEQRIKENPINPDLLQLEEKLLKLEELHVLWKVEGDFHLVH